MEDREYNQANQQGDYSQQYSQQYSYQQYANFGGSMVDAAGNPLKSHFAIQLVFAIIEILLCCLSPIAMILGIIALVFAIQANTAFTQCRAEEFKAKSKTSNILLIVGGIFAAIAIIINILVISLYATHFSTIFSEIENAIERDFQDEEGLDEENNLVEEYDSDIFEDYPGTDEVYLVKGFENFTYNGVAYSVPMSYEEFLKMGYSLEESYNEQYVLESQTYEFIGFYDAEGNEIGVIRISNDSEEQITLDKGMVDYIYFDNPASYMKDSSIPHIDLTFGNGFNMLTSYEELEAWLGTPYYVSIDTSDDYEYASYEWVYHGEDKYQRIVVNYIDGVITDIAFEQYDFVY